MVALELAAMVVATVAEAIGGDAGEVVEAAVEAAEARQTAEGQARVWRATAAALARAAAWAAPAAAKEVMAMAWVVEAPPRHRPGRRPRGRPPPRHLSVPSRHTWPYTWPPPSRRRALLAFALALMVVAAATVANMVALARARHMRAATQGQPARAAISIWAP